MVDGRAVRLALHLGKLLPWNRVLRTCIRRRIRLVKLPGELLSRGLARHAKPCCRQNRGTARHQRTIDPTFSFRKLRPGDEQIVHLSVVVTLGTVLPADGELLTAPT